LTQSKQNKQPRPLDLGLWCAPRGIRTPNRQIRSLVLCVDLVGSRRIWPAHVGGLVDPDGSRRIPSDRLDDQPDDQAPRRGVLGHPYHGDRCGARTRYFIWRCLADRRDSEQRAPDYKPADTVRWCWRVPSWRVRSGGPSSPCAPVVPRVALWNHRGNGHQPGLDGSVHRHQTRRLAARLLQGSIG
jgi:hypothetical protein